MRLLLIANLLILSMGIGYTFRIPKFLDPLFSPRNNNPHQDQDLFSRTSQERQSGDNELEEEILPLFLVTFLGASLWNLVNMGVMEAEVNCDDYQWCYEGDCAASTWGTCVEACNGMSQSPIDIPVAVQQGSALAVRPLTFNNYQNVRIDVFGVQEEHYRAQNGINVNSNGDRLDPPKLKNPGYTLQFDVNPNTAGVAGVLSGGPLGENYNILQLHFHWGADNSRGSEHTYSGREYPLEMHIVHYDSTLPDVPTILNTPKGLAVTGFMFDIDHTGTDNAALQPLLNGISSVLTAGSGIPYNTAAEGFNLNDLISPIATTSEYTYYSGSLTTPTCNEVVEWINILTPLKISSSQMAMFRTLMNGDGKPIVDNYRPPQPLNNRPVIKFGQ